MFIVGMLIGVLIGIGLMAFVVNRDVDNLLDDNYNAELRALTHFRKLQSIERILNKTEIEKTPAVIVVDKIKEVISSDQTNQ